MAFSIFPNIWFFFLLLSSHKGIDATWRCSAFGRINFARRIFAALLRLRLKCWLCYALCQEYVCVWGVYMYYRNWLVYIIHFLHLCMCVRRRKWQAASSKHTHTKTWGQRGGDSPESKTFCGFIQTRNFLSKVRRLYVVVCDWSAHQWMRLQLWKSSRAFDKMCIK